MKHSVKPWGLMKGGEGGACFTIFNRDRVIARILYISNSDEATANAALIHAAPMLLQSLIERIAELRTIIPTLAESDFRRQLEANLRDSEQLYHSTTGATL